MKKIKLITLLVFLVSFSLSSFGQLSERVNSNSTFKYGTRPVAGNLAIFIGANMQDYKDLQNRWNWDAKHPMDSVKNILPLVSIRYYLSDENVFRFGINSRRQNIKIVGDIFKPELSDSLTEVKYQRTTSKIYINPGIEHHFIKSNLADVYLGASIPIGLVTEKQFDYAKGNGSYTSITKSRKSLSYGFEGFVGIQAFIADLPLSIGVELGSTALVIGGKKWKVEYKNVVSGGTSTSETYYIINLDDADKLDKSNPTELAFSNTISTSEYKKLKAKTSSIDGMARITLSYYFAK